MKTLTTTGITEKNKLDNSGAWIILLDIDLTALGSTIFYWTSNNGNITWPTGGQVYSAMPIEVGEVQESAGGKIPSIPLRVSDVERVYAPYLVAFEGLQGATVRLRVVHSKHLSEATPEIDEVFSIVETKLDQQWMEFTLGSVDPLGRRFPRDRYVASMCRHGYKGALCRYAGAKETCDRTLVDCRLHVDTQGVSNEVQYGGSPGVAEGIYG